MALCEANKGIIKEWQCGTAWHLPVLHDRATHGLADRAHGPPAKMMERKWRRSGMGGGGGTGDRRAAEKTVSTCLAPEFHARRTQLIK